MDNPKMLQYYVVYSWMQTELGLDITERNIFAYVLAWNLQGMTYYASKATTAAFFGVSERKVAYVFDKLTKTKLLISKPEKMPQGNRRIHYVISQEVAAKYASAQLQKLQLVYAKFAGTHQQNLHEINNNKTDEYPSGYSKKRMNNVHAEACTSASADAPALPALLNPSHSENRTTSTQPHDPTFDEGEDIVPEPVTPAEQPHAKDLETVADGKKKKHGAKKEKDDVLSWDEYEQFCIYMGADFEDAAEHTHHRKDKGVKNTQYAIKHLRDVLLELQENYGIDPGRVFKMAAIGQWRGIEVRYVLDQVESERRIIQTGGYNRPTPAAKPGKIERTLQACEEVVRFYSPQQE